MARFAEKSNRTGPEADAARAGMQMNLAAPAALYSVEAAAIRLDTPRWRGTLGLRKDRSDMDLSRKGLHKGRPNLFADVIDRCKHEGDFQGAWRMSSNKNQEGQSSWLRRGMLFFTVAVAAVLVVAMVVMFQKTKNEPQSPHLPISRPIGAPPPTVPGTPPPPWKGSLAADPVPPGVRTAGADETGPDAAKPADGAEAPAGPDAANPPKRPTASGAPAEKAVVREIERDGGRFVFRPMLPEFKPLQDLDPNYIEDHSWDDIRWPDEANDIKKETEAVEHIFRFIRTHGADLSRRATPGVLHGDLLKEPESHRGQVIHTRVLVVKKYMNFGWPKNDSGVQDTTMLFCYPTNVSFGRAIYVVLAAQPPEDFKEEELYDLTGVFWKRYPYVNGKNEWQWHPLVLTARMTPAPVSSQTSHQLAIWIVVVAAVLIIGMLFLVRGETREGQAKRAARIERRRRGQKLPLRHDGLAPLQPAGDPHEGPGRDGGGSAGGGGPNPPGSA